MFELCNADVVGVVQDSPTVTADIDFYESDSMAGNTEIAADDPKDIVVTVNGASTLRYTLKKMISANDIRADRGTVRGWATRRYSYQIGAYDASYGLIIDKT